MSNFLLTPDILATVGKLSAKSRAEAMTIIGQREYEKIASDPIYWLDASQHIKTIEYPNGLPYVYTKDPHIQFECNQCGVEMFGDKRVKHLEIEHNHKETVTLGILLKSFKELNPIRSFTMMEYMPAIIKAWLTSQYIVIEKSRDMMATWLVVALFTWDALYHNGRQHLFQSQDAKRTEELVQRAKILYDYQPGFLKKAVGLVTFGKGNTKSGELFVHKQGSEILGFPQGPDQIRQYHPSGVLTDETAFQVGAAEGFAAIKPAIQAGGKYCGVSSANRSFFELLCRDKSDE